MDGTGNAPEYSATTEDLPAALNADLKSGDLNLIMGTLGQMARAHRMKRVARETGLGRERLYKSMRAGGSPEFNTVLKVLRSLGFCLQVSLIRDDKDQ